MSWMLLQWELASIPPKMAILFKCLEFSTWVRQNVESGGSNWIDKRLILLVDRDEQKIFILSAILNC